MKWTLGVALHDGCVHWRCLDMVIPHIDKGLNTRFLSVFTTGDIIKDSHQDFVKLNTQFCS